MNLKIVNNFVLLTLFGFQVSDSQQQGFDLTQHDCAKLYNYVNINYSFTRMFFDCSRAAFICFFKLNNLT